MFFPIGLPYALTQKEYMGSRNEEEGRGYCNFGEIHSGRCTH